MKLKPFNTKTMHFSCYDVVHGKIPFFWNLHRPVNNMKNWCSLDVLWEAALRFSSCKDAPHPILWAELQTPGGVYGKSCRVVVIRNLKRLVECFLTICVCLHVCLFVCACVNIKPGCASDNDVGGWIISLAVPQNFWSNQKRKETNRQTRQGVSLDKSYPAVIGTTWSSLILIDSFL